MKKGLVLFNLLLSVVVLLSSCSSDNESVVLFPVKSEKEYGYVDLEGKIIINPQFKEASLFRNGIALVKTSGEKSKWGFIGEDGKYIINAQYEEATVFSEGLAWVVMENAAPSAIDESGEIKFTLNNAEEVRVFKGGLAAYSVLNDKGDKNWGFADNTGSNKINPQFAQVKNFSENKCAVKNSEDKWGYIDTEGKLIINYQFDYAKDFKNGFAVVKSADKEGVIDQDGKYVINPQFSEMTSDGDFFLVKQDGKFGWCDKDGKIFINPQFEMAVPFNKQELACVKSGGKFGYIDIEGKIVINPQFEGATSFSGDLAPVLSSDKIGFIDRTGKYVINPQFKDISDDLILFLLAGSSAYESVYTDYFNVTSILSGLNLESPEGFTLNSTYQEIMIKDSIFEFEFSRYRDEYTVFSNKKLSADASLDFVLLGNPYEKNTVTKTAGFWSTYTYTDVEYQFNPQRKPNAYAYVINLENKGYGKADGLISGLKEKLSSYKRDDNRSNDKIDLYTKGSNNITLLKNNENRVTIIIGEVPIEIINSYGGNIEDGSAADSAAVADSLAAAAATSY